MTDWLAPACPLPVSVRPFGEETIVSYTRRLAAANGLPADNILRALGAFANGRHHAFNHDATLNEGALSRLEDYSGFPRSRLARALPGLHGSPGLESLPTDQPALRFWLPQPHPRPACSTCTLRSAAMPGPTAIVYPRSSPLVCQRHRRWLGAPGETVQYDLPAASDVLVAYWSCVRFLAGSRDTGWPAARFRAAWQVTRWWAGHDPDRFPAVSQRWHARATALGIPHEPPAPTVVTFPEAVVLAEILTDLNWRRHAAVVDVLDIDIFYQHVARRLGELPYPRSIPYSGLLRRWDDRHRNQLANTRNDTWEQSILRPQSFFPDIRQFRRQAVNDNLAGSGSLQLAVDVTQHRRAQAERLVAGRWPQRKRAARSRADDSMNPDGGRYGRERSGPTLRWNPASSRSWPCSTSSMRVENLATRAAPLGTLGETVTDQDRATTATVETPLLSVGEDLLLLRHLDPGDAHALEPMLNDPMKREMFRLPLDTSVTAEDWIAGQLALEERNVSTTHFPWSIVLPGPGTVIGCVKLERISFYEGGKLELFIDPAQRTNPDKPPIGVRFSLLWSDYLHRHSQPVSDDSA